ncbi:hypothetical protein TWF225_007572 [Orbilia oligospora]|uniref:Uncharacterized protein n=1 Tax=Orbilia oligospora TaxID=2813651 RepID=A0A7C8PIK3_ORBOL|nr:hypothetical protein TWF751_001073 [Orbilia oligospora]KAF3179368.1 hypothetical protein TWF225_007572 [Orbilia oligospora]KAF3253166.1 hypothetical protein TWF128_006594 [Orbilia oligospora]TGJ66877.1 hypothetical protein EYR41_008473 [Orbilia oligospora]
MSTYTTTPRRTWTPHSLSTLQRSGYTPQPSKYLKYSPIDFFHPSVICSKPFEPYLRNPYPKIDPSKIHFLLLTYLCENEYIDPKFLRLPPKNIEVLIDTCSYIFASKITSQFRLDMESLCASYGEEVTNEGGVVHALFVACPYTPPYTLPTTTTTISSSSSSSSRSSSSISSDPNATGIFEEKGDSTTVEEWIGAMVNMVCKEYNRKIELTKMAVAIRATGVVEKKSVWEVMKKGVMRALGVGDGVKWKDRKGLGVAAWVYDTVRKPKG